MDYCQAPSIFTGLCRRIWPVVWLLQLIYKMTSAQDSVTSTSESSGIDREWFLYGSLISLAAAFVFLMLFLCVCFCPCSESSSSQGDQDDLSRPDAGNEPYRGSMYNIYPGVMEPDTSTSTYELTKIESQNSRHGVNGSKINKGSPFLVGIKKLPDPSDQITSTDDKAVIESEIHETIRYISESIEHDGLTNGNCEVTGTQM